MTTLKERCFTAISKQIPKKNKGKFLANFIRQTPTILHEKAIDDIICAIEKQVADCTTAMMQITVPYITNDIITTMNTPDGNRENYYQKFEGVSLYIIDSSIIIAEKLAINMQERHMNKTIEVQQDWYNTYHYSDDEDDYNNMEYY